MGAMFEIAPKTSAMRHTGDIPIHRNVRSSLLSPSCCSEVRVHHNPYTVVVSLSRFPRFKQHPILEQTESVLLWRPTFVHAANPSWDGNEDSWGVPADNKNDPVRRNPWMGTLVQITPSKRFKQVCVYRERMVDLPPCPPPVLLNAPSKKACQK